MAAEGRSGILVAGRLASALKGDPSAPAQFGNPPEGRVRKTRSAQLPTDLPCSGPSLHGDTGQGPYTYTDSGGSRRPGRGRRPALAGVFQTVEPLEPPPTSCEEKGVNKSRGRWRHEDGYIPPWTVSSLLPMRPDTAGQP